ncbi:hypothetical protein [Amycolatopsis pithecellobii]|uniref:Core-binding (CB) domain-containing protein n=1 Tax=Amycolatopsis pithecellobii TaxID=664692 RepID=A0A6N7YHM4_9PSEU|nr:hypothetical protein [Amycolatopsis pithecellobii]MTD52385.1 hypothetical protein [Amycolatopsis pithecellobii]
MTTSTGVFKRCSCRDAARVELPAMADGRRRQLRRGGFRSQRARDYLRNPATADPAPATVSTAQWLQLWLDTRLGPRQSTLYTYRRHMRHYLVPYLGGTLLRSSPMHGCRRCSPL